MQEQTTKPVPAAQADSAKQSTGPSRKELRAWAQREFGGFFGAAQVCVHERERLPPRLPKPKLQRICLAPADLKRLGKKRRNKAAGVSLHKPLLWAPPSGLTAHDWHIACAIVSEARQALKARLHEMSLAGGNVAILEEKTTWRAYKAEKLYYGEVFKPKFGEVLGKEGRNGYKFRRKQILRDPALLGPTVTVRTSIRKLLSLAGLYIDKDAKRNTKASIDALAKPLQVMVGSKSIEFEPLAQGVVYDHRGVTFEVSTKWIGKPYATVVGPLVKGSVLALRLQLLLTMFDDDNEAGIAWSGLCARLGAADDRFFGRKLEAAVAVLDAHYRQHGLPGIACKLDANRFKFTRGE